MKFQVVFSLFFALCILPSYLTAAPVIEPTRHDTSKQPIAIPEKPKTNYPKQLFSGLPEIFSRLRGPGSSKSSNSPSRVGSLESTDEDDYVLVNSDADDDQSSTSEAELIDEPHSDAEIAFDDQQVLGVNEKGISGEEDFSGPLSQEDLVLGSKKAFVVSRQDCVELKKQPKRMKNLQTIYVSAEVFLECKFNPKTFPSLKKVYIQLRHYDEMLFDALLKDAGFVAMKEETLNKMSPFKLEKLSTFVFNQMGLENFVIENNFKNWLPFLLDYRDWADLEYPFSFWNRILEVAVYSNNKDAVTQLFQFENLKSFRQEKDPFALELAVTLGRQNALEGLKGNVNSDLFNALVAVKSGDKDAISQWLDSAPSPSLVSRVLAFVLNREEESEAAPQFIREISTMLADFPDIDLNYRDKSYSPLLTLAIKSKQWEVYDKLLSQSKSKTKVPDVIKNQVLHEAIISGMDKTRFEAVLDMGANTFYPDIFHRNATPLILAIQVKDGMYEEAIIKRRLVEKSRHQMEIKLTKNEKKFIDDRGLAHQILGGYAVRIVSYP